MAGMVVEVGGDHRAADLQRSNAAGRVIDIISGRTARDRLARHVAAGAEREGLLRMPEPSRISVRRLVAGAMVATSLTVAPDSVRSVRVRLPALL
jgi:hypothetical protein